MQPPPAAARRPRRWGRPSTDGVAFAAFAAVVSLICLRPVLLHPGWPVNHDGAKMFFRTEVFAAHFSQRDFFPVWSGSDAIGYGTPMPTYYQRLYSTLSGALLLLVHDVKLATILSLFALMLVGAFGMWAAVRVLTESRPLRFAIPAAFLLSNYTFTDWLVRGAAAEFSAMMLVPWLLWWSLVLVVEGRFCWSIIAIFGLLFYAHNAIALISVLVPLFAFLVHVITLARDQALTLRMLVRPLVSAAGTLALVAPALALQLRMNRDFDPTEKITQDFNIAGGFRDAHDYLLDRHYTWLTSGGGYSVQLNIVGWVTLVLLSLAAAVRLVIRPGRAVRRPAAASLLLLPVLATYCFFQLRASLSTYDLIPLLPEIQFPWRMLTLITPLYLLTIAHLGGRRPPDTDGLRDGRRMAAGTALWLAGYLLLSPATAADRLPRLDTLISASDGFYESGEYTPRTRSTDGARQLTGSELLAYYSRLSTEPPACGLREAQHDFEDRERRFELTCQGAGLQALPVTFSAYTRIWIDGRSVRPARSAFDPRLLVELPDGPSRVRVVEPGFARVLLGRAG